MKHAAILGAGVMGASAALMLAQRDWRVSLFDEAPAPFSGASRWNEGKIHLGYLYAGDASLDSARRVLPGGLAFKPLTEALLGCSLEPACTQVDDTYVVHEHSIASLDTVRAYAGAIHDLANSHPDAAHYLAPLSPPAELSRAELARDFEITSLSGGFRVSERSVSTQWVADRFLAALAGEQRITQVMNTRVHAVHPRTNIDGPFDIETAHGGEGPFDLVINALWHGRLAIDRGLGLPMPPEISHRYRVSLFVRTSGVVALPSAVIAAGPFGDVKNYNGRDFYLSWYAAGLRAEGNAPEPPAAPMLSQSDRASICDATFTSLKSYIPAVANIEANIEDVRVEGGWVYAAGKGALADPRSTLHRRDRIGVARAGSYFSVDTGKYSIAPWLARTIADMVQQK